MTENEQLPAGVTAKAHNTRPWGWPSLPEPVPAATLLDSPPAGEPAAVVQYVANRESGRKDPTGPGPRARVGTT